MAERGVVHAWFREKGYGFIQGDLIGPNFFIRRPDLKDANDDFKEGDKISYDVLGSGKSTFVSDVQCVTARPTLAHVVPQQGQQTMTEAERIERIRKLAEAKLRASQNLAPATPRSPAEELIRLRDFHLRAQQQAQRDRDHPKPERDFPNLRERRDTRYPHRSFQKDHRDRFPRDDYRDRRDRDDHRGRDRREGYDHYPQRYERDRYERTEGARTLSNEKGGRIVEGPQPRSVSTGRSPHKERVAKVEEMEKGTEGVEVEVDVEEIADELVTDKETDERVTKGRRGHKNP